MKSIGNIKSNAIYNPNELRYPPPPNLEDSERDSELEQYIRCKRQSCSHCFCIHLQPLAKYQYRKFLDKSALVASKLGPSKSATFVEKTASERSKSQSSTLTDHTLTTTAATSSVVIPPRRPIVPPVHSAPKANTSNLPGLEKKPTPVPSLGTSSVWNDLSSLANPGQDSSLPLQYQLPISVASAQPQTINGPMGMGYPVGVTPTGMGINSFQLGSQQPMLSPFTPSHSMSPSPLFNNAQSQQPFGQPWVTSSTQPAPVMTQTTAQTSFFQPQPQLSVQLQTTPGQSILSHSPNQQFLSGPVTQSQFLVSSPSQQFRSHSSQPQMQPLQPMRTSSGFLLQSPMSAQFNMGPGAGMTTPGQSSFLGTTTMQMMQHQQMLQQQQAAFGAPQTHPMAASQMAPGPNTFGGGQMYSQWGAM